MKTITLTDEQQRMLIPLLEQSRQKQENEAVIQEQENRNRPEVIDKKYDPTVYQVDYQLLIKTINEIIKKLKE